MSGFNLWGLIEGVSQYIANGIKASIENTLSKIDQGVENGIIKPITTDVGTAIDHVGSALAAIERESTVGIANVLGQVGQTLNYTERAIAGGFERSISDIGNSLHYLSENISFGFGKILTGIETSFGALKTGVENAFKIIANGIESGFMTVGKYIVSGLNDIITPISAFLKALPEDLQAIGKELTDTLKEWLDEYKKNTGLQEAAQLLLSAGPNTEFPKIFDIKDNTTAEGAIGGYLIQQFGKLAGIDTKDLDPASLERIIGSVIAEGLLGAVLIEDSSAAFLLSNAMPPIVDAALVGAYRNLNQVGNAGTPNQILGVGDLIAGKYKKYITDQRFYKDMSMAGIGKEVADKMYSIADVLLGGGELITLYRRGLLESKEDLYTQANKIRVSKYQVDKYLELYDKLLGIGESVELWRREIMPEGFNGYFDDVLAGGITPERLDAVKKSSYKLPTTEQYQRFLQRGVFDEKLVSKYEDDYLLDEAFYKNAKAVGYDKKTAKALYRAQWEVPPFFITEGLFKAGQLQEEPFRGMLALEGYTPYWIDTLVDNLKPKMTPADIKSMFQHQLITSEEIPIKLEANGMAHELAVEYQKLWVASIHLASPLNQTSTQSKAHKMKDETEGLVKSAYVDKIINKTEAIKALENLNYTNETAQMIIGIADYKEKISEIETIAQTVAYELKARSITLTHAINKIQEAGATPLQLDKYTAELTKMNEVKDKLPSKTEFESWYKKGIISVAQLASSFSILGYSNVWIPFLLAAAGVPTKVIKKDYSGKRVVL